MALIAANDEIDSTVHALEKKLKCVLSPIHRCRRAHTYFLGRSVRKYWQWWSLKPLTSSNAIVNGSGQGRVKFDEGLKSDFFRGKLFSDYDFPQDFKYVISFLP